MKKPRHLFSAHPELHRWVGDPSLTFTCFPNYHILSQMDGFKEKWQEKNLYEQENFKVDFKNKPSQTQTFFTPRTVFTNVKKMLIEDSYAVCNVCKHL